MAPTPRHLAAVALFVAGCGLMFGGRGLWELATGEPVGDELLLASAAMGDPAGVERALAGGAAIDARTPSGSTALSMAAGDANVAIVALLLAHGADVNAARADGITALAAAAHSACDRETIQMLLDAGADANGGPICRPLVSAAARGDEAVVAMLLASGADPELPGLDGLTAFDAARQAGHADLPDLLSPPACAR